MLSGGQMNIHPIRSGICIAFIALAASSAVANDGADKRPAALAKQLLTEALPNIPGKEVTMLTVEYPPGGASGAHRHNASTFVYVLEGSVVMQVEGGSEVTLAPGDTFYESPTDVHTISRNASDVAPAKFLVMFVKDQGAPTTTPASQR
jgi:quercetin dioxygenase-like cupin family protein